MKNKKYTIQELQKICHQIALKKGFWGDICLCKYPIIDKGFCNEDVPLCVKCLKRTDKNRNDGEAIALMHSELSEVLEALRDGDYSHVGEELADLLIRVMDYAEGKNIDLEKEIVKKMKKNKKRPYRHGRQF